MTLGPGIFFDGMTSARRPVTVELEPASIIVRDAIERHILARWPHGELERLTAPEGMVRLGRARNGSLARIEIRDPTFARTMTDLAATVGRASRAGRGRVKVV